MERVTESIVRVPVSHAEVYPTDVWLLDCAGGLILVDVGFTEECTRSIASALTEMKKTWSDIKLILITHAHGDHIGCLSRVVELTGGADVMLGAGDAASLAEQTGVTASMELEDGDIIGACSGIQVVSTPGHSRGNICLYLKGEKTMILGDTVMEVEGSLSPPPEEYSDDPKKASKSIAKLLAFDFDTMLMSHGRPVVGGAKKEIESLVARVRRSPR